MHFGLRRSLFALFLSMALPMAAQNQEMARELYNYYQFPDPDHPITVNPHKWVDQPLVNSWESMEQAAAKALKNRDGYGLYQLAYLEYVHNYTISKLNPKTMLYNAFDIGKENGDPNLMYWITEFEGTAYFRYEYLQRRRNHALWTDSVATEKKDFRILYLLADLNDKCFIEMKSLAAQYLQCAYLKEESYGLLPHDVREKALEMEKNASQK